MTLPTSVKTLKSTYDSIRSKWNTFEAAHRYTPPGVVFATGTAAGTHFQVCEGVETVAVPINRVSGTTKAETTSLRVTYPDASVATNTLAWVANETNKIERIDVFGPWEVGKTIKLTLFDTTTKKQIGAAATIDIVEGGNSFSFPDIEFDEGGDWGRWTLYSEANWAKALAKTVVANTYSQPDTNLIEAVNVVMDVPIAPSNRYEVAYTNDITFFADSKKTADSAHEFKFTVTNLITTVYTNDLAAFDQANRADEETEEMSAVFPGELLVVTNYVATEDLKEPEWDQSAAVTKTVQVTNCVFGVESADDENPVEWTWARTAEEKQVECFTNYIVYAEANAEHEAGTATTNNADLVCSAKGTKRYYLNRKVMNAQVEVPVSEAFASNCVYAVVPQADDSTVTNLYSSADSTYSNVVEVANEIVFLPCNGEHAEPSTIGPIAKADDPEPVERTFRQPDVQTYYTVLSNWQETVEQEHVGYGTNRTFYVEMPGCVTNEDVAALVPVGKATMFATTNFYQVALTNAENAEASSEVTWTNFEATVAVACTNYYYAVETNEYQYGEAGREQGGRDGKRIQSFVLKVTGSAVWNADTVAFAASVLDNEKFANWCALNNIVTVLHECADPATGASLFSYAVAANGRSGTAFLSRNGLAAPECEQPAASNVFEVALYRPDGTLAAILAPQRNEGVFDGDENLARLDEMLSIADDLTEVDNNDAATTPLKAYYGRTVATEPSAELYTLNISDKKDVFELMEIPAGTYVSITVPASPASRYNGQEKPQVKVWRYASGAVKEIPSVGEDQEGSPVWIFTQDDVAAGLYADVTAWTADYAATGKFGDSVFTYPLTAVEASEFPGVVSFVNASNEVFDIDSETTIELRVKRTGYTGAVTATVALDSSELPADSFSWTHGANNTTNLVWRDGEFGEKIIPVMVRNVMWEDSTSNLVFTISSVISDSGATLDETKKTCKIGIQQEDDEKALTGRIRITSPEFSVGETLWKKEGEVVAVTVTRERVLNEETQKNEARGEATATITAVGGASLSTNSVDWLKGMRIGDRNFTIKMPTVGKSGEQQVVLTVVGADSDGNIISEAAKSRIKFMVVPADAPEFRNGIDSEAYQYVTFNEIADLVYDPEKMEIVGFDVLSGTLPAGLSATAEESGLRISGVPTGTNSANVVYQMTLLRKSDGYLVKTMPVRVKITAKALGGAASGDMADAVIPAFAERRVWQYLPMTNGENRLVGLLNLSASVRGSVSARYTTVGYTVMFSKGALDSVAPDEAGGGYRASVYMEKAGYSLNVSFTTDGRVFATLIAPDEGCSAGFASEVGAKPWALSGGATDWKGRYVAAFPLDGVAPEAEARGTAAIALNMASSAMTRLGRVTFNGVLPNGKPMNGTTAIVPAAAGATGVKIPIFWNSASDSFAAMLVATKTQSGVTAALDPEVAPYWSGEGGGVLSATGALFVADAWADSLGGKTLRFKYDGAAGGATVTLDGKSLKITGTGSVAADGFELVSIVLNRTSGMMTGTLNVPIDGQISTINFRGVALPLASGRLMMGSAWYTATREGVPVRLAVPVEIVPDTL